MPSEEFSRDCRLTKHLQFQKVYREGKRFHGNLINLIILPSDENETRVGFTVKKTVNNVVRNRVKRRLRELFRRHRGLLPRRPLWMVLHVKGTGDLSFGDLHDDYLQLMKKMRTWCVRSC